MPDNSYPSSWVVTGMPNAGKTTATDMLGEAGFPVYTVGDAVRYVEANTDGYTVDNRGQLLIDMKEEHGDDFFVRTALEIQSPENEYGFSPVISGVRQQEEVDFLQDYYDDTETVAIVVGKGTRKERYKDRNEDEDFKEFEERDQREIRQGLGELVTRPDRYIVNDRSFEDLARDVGETFEFRDNIYTVSQLENVVNRVEFQNPEHAVKYANKSDHVMKQENGKVFIPKRLRTEAEIDEDIQSFYTSLMTEAI